MWRNDHPPCRTFPGCPLNGKAPVGTMALILDYRLGGDDLPCTNPRYMCIEKAQELIIQGCQNAIADGCTSLLVNLAGGEPLVRFTDFAELCGWSRKNAPIPVKFSFLIRSTVPDGEKLRWCLENQDFLCPVLRLDALGELNRESVDFCSRLDAQVIYTVEPGHIKGLATRSLIPAVDAGIHLERTRGTKSVLTEDDLEEYGAELQKLLDHGKPIHHQAGEEMTGRSAIMNSAISAPMSPAGCFDTNGYAYPCLPMSPARLDSWDMEDRLIEGLASREMKGRLSGFICPGLLLRVGAGGREAVKTERHLRNLEQKLCILSWKSQKDIKNIIFAAMLEQHDGEKGRSN